MEKKKVVLNQLNNAQESVVARLLQLGPEFILNFAWANGDDEYANEVAMNAMHRAKMIDENLKFYPDWKERCGLPFDWDADLYRKYRDHSYSKDPKFNPNAK